MGQPVKFIARVTNAQGSGVGEAQVTITMRDPDDSPVTTLAAVPDHEGVYRTAGWAIPHRTREGRWNFVVKAKTDYAEGDLSGSFKVKNSTSEVLLGKYGFWLDAPALRNIEPQIFAERGDARNGMIRWGGVKPAQHILPENWVEIHWREGDYRLGNPESVRRFMLNELGDLGFTPVRDIGPFQPIKFKQWDAWRAGARGQFSYDQMEFVVFYAPEVNRTFAIATTAVLPPPHVDPHAILRDSFAVFPDLHATGVAPAPLPGLLPQPELIGPPLGARFTGLDQPIILQWEPVKQLSRDEYYQVAVDYNDREGNPTANFKTRQTQFTLPETLYRAPNCHVFNWQVTLMRQTGIGDDGQPGGEPVSYSSLYWYVWWSYPPGEKEPFTTTCPNEQF